MLNASGIGVYLRECLPWFISSSNLFLLLGDAADLRSRFGSFPNVKTADCRVKPFSLRELFFFPPSLLKSINQSDLYYSPFFNIPGGIRIPVYTTIHDVIFPDMPELTSRAGLFLRMWFYKRAAGHSKKIFTVSCFSKSRIRHFLNPDIPIIVTYSALQSCLLTAAEPVPKKENIVFIGNIKRHKGLWCLLEAFRGAKKEGLPHKLIIVGNKDNFRSADREAIKHIDGTAQGEIEFTGPIDNEKLRELLAGAELLVQPSLYEGFGLPPLEALVLGTRALISDIPVFREIYDGFPVTYFTAGDSGDLKRKMTELLLEKKQEALRLPVRLKNKYSFQKTAALILKELHTP
jgi:glycosyltransferase involved in cell wall biosynthesis